MLFKNVICKNFLLKYIIEDGICRDTFLATKHILSATSSNQRKEKNAFSASFNLLLAGSEFPLRLCDPLQQYDFIMSVVTPLW